MDIYIYIYIDKDKKLEISKIKSIEFGDEECMAIVVKDINILEQLEIEKVKQKYSEMFILCLSHELRTPLNGILGVSEAMEDNNIMSESEMHECITQIKNSSYLLKHLIESVQDLSKIQTDNFSINMSLTNPKKLVKKCLSCIESEFIKRNLDLEVNFLNRDSNSRFPKEIELDGDRYLEVLLSLLINAAKYTYKGNVKVELDYDYHTSLLVTTIADTGIGIDPAFIPYMFSLYGKLKMDGLLASQNSDPTEGMYMYIYIYIYIIFVGIGIGLTISKEIIERMGGELEVNSVQNAGTNIKFSIPTNRQPEHISTQMSSKTYNLVTLEGEETKEKEIKIFENSHELSLKRNELWPSRSITDREFPFDKSQHVNDARNIVTNIGIS